MKLNIPQVARDHALPVKITLAGSKEKVVQVKAIVTELTQYYRSDITHPNTVHLEMDVPTNYYNYIIGARGSEIKHIQGNFKVSVHIPNADTVNKNVVIVGDSSNVKNAEKYIQKIIDGVAKDKEEAERLQDTFGSAGGREDAAPPVEEEWMNQYTHPSRKAKATTDASTEEDTTATTAPNAATTAATAVLATSTPSPLASSDSSADATASTATAGASTGSAAAPAGGDATIMKTGEKSSAAAAAAASAWGASVLASADGW